MTASKLTNRAVNIDQLLQPLHSLAHLRHRCASPSQLLLQATPTPPTGAACVRTRTATLRLTTSPSLNWAMSSTTPTGWRRCASRLSDYYSNCLGSQTAPGPSSIVSVCVSLQVAAMEKRAAAIGAPKLFYAFPDNGGLTSSDAAAAVAAGLPIERLLTDLHVGSGGAVEASAQLFANPPIPGFDMGTCEYGATRSINFTSAQYEDPAVLHYARSRYILVPYYDVVTGLRMPSSHLSSPPRAFPSQRSCSQRRGERREVQHGARPHGGG